MRLLNIVRFTVQQHGEMLNKLCEVLPSHAVVVRPRLVEQPFNKLDDLFAFDKTLVNEKAAMLVSTLIQLHRVNNAAFSKRRCYTLQGSSMNVYLHVMRFSLNEPE